MFRVDRRFVKLTGNGANKSGKNEKGEVGADGEYPNAATSAEDMVNMYRSAAERELGERADAIIAEARDKAEQILSEADMSAEEIRNKAYDDGFAEGDRKGRSEHDKKLREQLAENEETLKNVLDEIACERQKVADELHEELASLAIEIVRKIINPAEEELGNVYTSLIKNAMRQMLTDSKMVIYVGAREYERYFSSGSAKITLDSGVTVTASVVKDAGLSDGDLLIDADDVTVNAGLNSQLKYVELAFQRANQYEP
ncbi:MAG: FliH/SctL family protein [Oscillospiraceae bacterium]|nr:FliH/SctL family protein [Oscillospiraceae bacterium]